MIGYLFDLGAKIVLMWPSVVAQIVLLLSIVVFSFYNNIEIETNSLIVCLVLVVGGIGNLLEFDNSVNTIFSIIPFINVEIMKAPGFVKGAGVYFYYFGRDWV